MEMELKRFDSAALPKFKNAELAKATKAIADLGDTRALASRKIAEVLGHVLSSECYKEDGFKSVAEYAEKTFGIKYATAYAMAKVGNRFYNSDAPLAKSLAEHYAPSNLLEIAGMTDDEISAKIESGEISTDKTQKELREVAKSVKPAKAKTEVLKNYHVQGRLMASNGVVELIDEKSTTLEKFELSCLFVGEVKKASATLENIDGKPEKCNVWFDGVGNVAWFRAEEVKKPKFNQASTKNSQPKYTIEQLREMLAAAEAAGE